ncbi:NAD-dependent epimerase/dehydratase family protein [Streptomyces sp. NPDC059080]|uniref:NAD-dependent epimerase/dehydratase family protein n=1 Tax=Streptomyces sp. NPDC059080 TaxID=3346718 RepID=UPI0036ADB179
MKLLMLGGTEFVGRSVVEEALARGWQVTVFHRGNSAPPPGVEVRIGDRSAPGGLAALEDGTWDAVVDTWKGAPAAARDAAQLLSGRIGRHVYISSRSVHPIPSAAGLDETGPVVDASPDDTSADDYARAKRGAELAIQDAFGDRAVLARAGLVLGPYENIGRLPWWLGRVARGGPVLAPGPRDLPLQYIDARDLARWSLDALRDGIPGGAYNLVSPTGHATMGEFLDACIRATGADAELHWADPEAVTAAGIEPWTELPVWLPPGDLHDTLHRGDVTKALATGLRCRPVAETVADTWEWLRSIGGAVPERPGWTAPGLSPEKEAAFLAA